jgi:hypothetical protein
MKPTAVTSCSTWTRNWAVGQELCWKRQADDIELPPSPLWTGKSQWCCKTALVLVGPPDPVQKDPRNEMACWKRVFANSRRPNYPRRVRWCKLTPLSRRSQKLSGSSSRCSALLSILCNVFGVVYVQSQLNKVWDQSGNRPVGTPIAA